MKKVRKHSDREGKDAPLRGDQQLHQEKRKHKREVIGKVSFFCR